MRKLILILLFPLSCLAQDRTTWTFLNGRFLQIDNNLSEITPATARQNLGLVIGTNVLAPNGNGSQLTNLTASQVGLGNVTNESKATMFTAPAFTGLATAATITASGAITSSGTAGMGYSTGAGGTITQATSKSTGVTLNKTCGQITMNNSALAAGAEVKFTVTNSTVAATDVPVVVIKSGGTSGSYLISVSAVAAGSFDIVISNASAGSLSEAIVLSFGLIKATSN